MTRTYPRARGGFTLVEMLVVMFIIVALGALALLLAPSVTNQDRTLAGTATVQGSLKIAQGMAAATKSPHGVRLITPLTGAPFVTELQYIESPPVLVFNRTPLATRQEGTTAFPITDPRLRFEYVVASAPTPPATDPPLGSIIRRRCVIENLTAEHVARMRPGGNLVLPVLGTWHKITRITTADTAQTLPLDPMKRTLTITTEMEVYPDPFLGTAGGPPDNNFHTVYTTYHFGFYGAPQPLLGEPVIQMPKDIAVDLRLSSPPSQPGNANYDILFAPSGQLVDTSGAQIFLWVRDVTRVANFPNPFTTTGPPLINAFRRGGEQQIVGIRGRSGAIGTAPVLWPDANGNYAAGQNPYTFARQQLTGP